MKIETIQYPTALVRLSNKELIGINMSLISGSPRIGCQLEKVEGGYKVTGNNADPDCVGGVCPIK